jgi:hypothetical protein
VELVLDGICLVSGRKRADQNVRHVASSGFREERKALSRESTRHTTSNKTYIPKGK